MADASLSTRCGAHGTLIAALIARSLAAVGLSAVLFQDLFGMITFDEGFNTIASARPRVGKPHVLYCVDLYQSGAPGDTPGGTAHSLSATIEGVLRRPALVPVISDFLFADAPRIIDELSRLNAVHDVFLLMVDARFAYRLQAGSSGWIRIADVESGGTRVVSRREFARLGETIGHWQTQLLTQARDAGLDIVRVGVDRWEMETTLVEFTAERRLRKA